MAFVVVGEGEEVVKDVRIAVERERFEIVKVQERESEIALVHSTFPSRSTGIRFALNRFGEGKMYESGPAAGEEAEETEVQDGAEVDDGEASKEGFE